MNFRILNRLLIALALLLAAGAVLVGALLVRPPENEWAVEETSFAPSSYKPGAEPEELLGPLPTYSAIHNTSHSLLNSVAPPASVPLPKWELIRLIQTTQFEGTWEAIVECPKNRSSARGLRFQRFVKEGDTITIALTRPIIVRNQPRTSTATVTVTQIEENIITLTDSEGRKHTIRLGL